MTLLRRSVARRSVLHCATAGARRLDPRVDAALRQRPGTVRIVSEWPEPVQRVAAFLEESGAEARIEEFSAGTPTAKEAAEAVGCALGDIVKSLVFRCDGRAIVVLVPGDRRADADKVAGAVGCTDLRIARGGEIEQATGFTPGAVAPFPLPAVDTVLVD